MTLFDGSPIVRRRQMRVAHGHPDVLVSQDLCHGPRPYGPRAWIDCRHLPGGRAMPKRGQAFNLRTQEAVRWRFAAPSVRCFSGMLGIRSELRNCRGFRRFKLPSLVYVRFERPPEEGLAVAPAIEVHREMAGGAAQVVSGWLRFRPRSATTSTAGRSSNRSRRSRTSGYCSYRTPGC